MAAHCLPTDAPFLVDWQKIKGRNTGAKALETILCMTVTEHPEGHNNVHVAVPHDGDNGSAMLFYEALMFADQAVRASVASMTSSAT